MALMSPCPRRAHVGDLPVATSTPTSRASRGALIQLGSADGSPLRVSPPSVT